MNDLIKVNYDNADRPTVSGRELHAALEVKTDYPHWFDRMKEYGFTEGEDFNSDKIVRVQTEGTRDVSPTTQSQSQWQRSYVCSSALKRAVSSASTSSR